MVGVYGNEVFRTWGSLESPFQRVNYSAEKLTDGMVRVLLTGHPFKPGRPFQL